MTPEELAAAIARPRLNRDDPRRVVVQTANGGIPHAHMAEVQSAVYGFDWTAGLFILHTTEPVVVVREIFNKTLSELGRERLEQLKAAHLRIFPEGSYIAKAREREWIDGFKEGIRMHVTATGDDHETK